MTRSTRTKSTLIEVVSVVRESSADLSSSCGRLHNPRVVIGDIPKFRGELVSQTVSSTVNNTRRKVSVGTRTTGSEGNARRGDGLDGKRKGLRAEGNMLEA